MVFGEGAPRAVDKASAEIAFNEVIRDLADAASGKRLLVENVGHYSLLPRDGRNYLSGPLDHFFPWEIARFRDFVRQEGLDNVEPFVVVAQDRTSDVYGRSVSVRVDRGGGRTYQNKTDYRQK